MQTRLVAAVLIMAFGWPQAFGWTQAWATGFAPQQTPAPAEAAAATIELPAGTAVPLNLVSTIKSKSSKPGDAVQAVVAFPVTVGNQLAIPAGTYVQGTLVRTAAPKGSRKVKNSGPALQIHFTKLLFANGYTVALDAENAAAGVGPLGAAAEGSKVATIREDEPMGYAAGVKRSYGPSADEAFDYAQPQFPEPTPTLPPLPQVGPSKAAVIGGVLGGFAVLTTVLLVLAHRARGGSDSVLYAAGWQFQMTLGSALTLDRAQVRAAASAGAVSR